MQCCLILLMTYVILWIKTIATMKTTCGSITQTENVFIKNIISRHILDESILNKYKNIIYSIYMTKKFKTQLCEKIISRLNNEISQLLNENQFDNVNDISDSQRIVDINDPSNVVSAIIVQNKSKTRNYTIVGALFYTNGSERVDICYPLCVSEPKYLEFQRKHCIDFVDCGETSVPLEYTIDIRPATADEIKRWRKADGVASSLRFKANTADKVRDIKWIWHGLHNENEKLVQSMDDIG